MLDLVKDFTEEQIEHLKTLSKSELLDLKARLQTASSSNNTAQTNRKLLINSLYGSMGNIFSRIYDLRNAIAITSYGQLAIRWVSRKVDEELNRLLATNSEKYVFYIDTDSVVGDTLIDVNGSQITIEDYYDSISDNNLVRNLPKDFVKTVHGDTSLGSKECMTTVRRPINYIMKHKVNKRMYKIVSDNNSVIITEDHSLMVVRYTETDRGLVSVKPSDIKPTDFIYLRNGDIHSFTIEDLGIQEQYVYDIEVDEVHNFFANDILVHNSIYVDMDNLVDKVKEKKTFKTDNELVDFLDNFAKTKMQGIIDSAMQELFEYMNNFENLMAMDREVISMPSLDSKGLGGFWTAKKRYALNVYDSEGTRFAKPKLKILGLETQRSSTPEALRDVLKESIRVILQEGETALHKQVDTFKDLYHSLHYTEIAKVTSANNLAKYANGDSYISGTPGHVRGSLLYNRLLRENNLVGATPIMEGSKVMEISLKVPNPWQEKTICWPSGLELPLEIEDEIVSFLDYNDQFEKTFIKPLETMTAACGIKHEQINDLSSFFSF